MLEAYCDVSDEQHPVCTAYKTPGAACDDGIECGGPVSSAFCDHSNGGEAGVCVKSSSASCVTP
jgi:hypothetical protein